MRLLAIDTSSSWLSVAVADDTTVLASVNEQTNLQHGTVLIPRIQQLLSQHQIPLDSIDGLVVGMGPGSYTGLRIGVTAAKMWAISKKLPLYAVSSLAMMAASVTQPNENAAIIPLMDARRLSAYIGYYHRNQDTLVAVEPDCHQDWQTWVADHLDTLAQYQTIYLVGELIESFVEILSHQLPQVDIIVQMAYPQTNRAFNLMQEPVSDVHVLAPNYTQVTLAEREWSEKKEQLSDDEMVQTTVQ
ncbi:tRNA (adenosine(37)-N6)-threonylcarbamoyltransferase complex dimerization subunit type 1 TsaB [Tuanshanicoccus lijuaniae]|uniref:tRNA (adenosine(37)-N6)-threonylcarbamoyltransferase complex dimerization subunit type 1 TsaB n=1 Tax=Aerococcaceae bacterium zg-1292 TaxID=2774330 RepID=UPI001936F6F9|nr:tRNA (adenosine(37)-N6)-threonylcarbamoyltransferase complex dimerization subunit type 1 TsaB [Aerococcaceae bacterium zg-1292]QQA37342.1 tRNA (adenosine(37)-N6)-threonylcarbamoyltransferase complex dimerization subunit type 1 TsaB [Aerococcaceae bacterium zg-1292]